MFQFLHCRNWLAFPIAATFRDTVTWGGFHSTNSLNHFQADFVPIIVRFASFGTETFFLLFLFLIFLSYLEDI